MTFTPVLCLLLAAAGSDAENGTRAEKFVVEHPTLRNLGFEWSIRGDANRNATVNVAVPESGRLELARRPARCCASAARTSTGGESTSITRFPRGSRAAFSI